MLFPDERGILARIAAGDRSVSFDFGVQPHLDWRARVAQRERAGCVAGSVLALYYAHARTGWPKLPKPSLRAAYNIALALGRGQEPDSPLDEMTRTEHRGKGNFKKNHSNTRQNPSKIDRGKFDKEREVSGKMEWDSGRWKQ